MAVNSNDFMFAIGVNGLNLTDSKKKKYFNLSISMVSFIKD